MGGRFILLLAALLFSAWPDLSRAASTTAINRLHIQATLAADGSVQIEQQIELVDSASLDWTVYSNVHNLVVEADGEPLKNSLVSVNSRGGKEIIRSAWESRHWRLRYRTTTNLIRHDNRDQMYYKIFEEPGRQIYNITVSFQLPLKDQANLSGNAYALSGVTGTETTVAAKDLITYTASSAGPKSIFTVSASWPKSVLQLTSLQELRLRVLDLELLPWLLLGILLPLISLIILAELCVRQRQNEKKVTAISEAPPNNLAPILVGVLVNKKIHPNEIVSLIVDLCQRGYVVIIKKGFEYFLGARKPIDNQLQSWERDIIEQLFANADVKVSENNLKTLGNQALFSPKVRHAFGQIYQIITELEFFVENPHLTRIRYKLFALTLYFLSAAGLIWTAISGSSPYLIIPLSGTIFIAFTIIRLSPQLIRYTPLGLETRAKWLAFANYLRLNKPLRLEAAQNQVFERYLAYAIALHSADQWAKRFDASSLAIVKPEWFVSYQESSTLELSKELTEFTKSISKELSKLRGPQVN